MKVRLQEIDERPTHFSFQLSAKDLEKLEDRFQFEQMGCEALLSKKKDFVALKGRYTVKVTTTCDLCLAPMSLEFDETFELDLVSEDSQQDLPGDVEISIDSPEIDTYSEDVIDLTWYFGDQLVLDLPLNVKCSEACRGLCSVCGQNLNQKSCNCQTDLEENPFSILKDLTSDTSQ